MNPENPPSLFDAVKAAEHAEKTLHDCIFRHPLWKKLKELLSDPTNVLAPFSKSLFVPCYRGTGKPITVKSIKTNIDGEHLVFKIRRGVIDEGYKTWEAQDFSHLVRNQKICIYVPIRLATAYSDAAFAAWYEGKMQIEEEAIQKREIAMLEELSYRYPDKLSAILREGKNDSNVQE